MITFSHKQRIFMSEQDTSGRVDRKNLPTQRQPLKQASLRDVLVAATENSAERAKTVVGNTSPRRQAGFMNELMVATDALSRKWGVDPQQIPVQPIREIQIVYQKPPPSPKPPSRPEPMIRQRPPSDDEQINQTNNLTTEQNLQMHKGSPAIINTYELALANVLSERPLRRAIAIMRSSRGLSQRVLAELVGISLSMVDKMERGRRHIKPALVEDICDVFELGEGSIIRKILVEKSLEEERIRRSVIQARRKTVVSQSLK